MFVFSIETVMLAFSVSWCNKIDPGVSRGLFWRCLLVQQDSVVVNITFGTYRACIRLVTIYSHAFSKNWVIVEFWKMVEYISYLYPSVLPYSSGCGLFFRAPCLSTRPKQNSRILPDGRYMKW